MKTKDLNIIYNKIVNQSKKTFFLNDLSWQEKFKYRVELFQLNLIIILWYMKFHNLDKKNTDYIINFFINDIENLIREFGEPDSRIVKKVRIMTENFYGRLYAYSKIFDEMVFQEKCPDLKKKLKKNFVFDFINYSELENYIFSNIKFFSKLKVLDFLKLKFGFVNLKI